MLMAITRAVSPAINRCELSFVDRQEIDLSRAETQHQEYEAALAALGANVLSLPAEPDYPDSVFVEDPAVVLDEAAIIARLGAASRRGEAESLARALAPFRPLHWMPEPATLEGGDVLRAGRKIFVGASGRTNAEGIAWLASELKPFGYSVQGVEVRGCLHLKSACSYLGDHTILANRDWIDTACFEGFRIVDAAPEEPRAANTLTIGGAVLIPACFPETAGILQRNGWTVRPVDVSELLKAESGVTCSSLIFES
jgi:dimethylargininase